MWQQTSPKSQRSLLARDQSNETQQAEVKGAWAPVHGVVALWHQPLQSGPEELVSSLHPVIFTLIKR